MVTFRWRDFLWIIPVMAAVGLIWDAVFPAKCP
jgi:hypothetical protein